MMKTVALALYPPLLVAAFLFGSTFGPKALDPMCALVAEIEPDAKCESHSPKEGKVTFPDKAELYCKLKPKAGLVCNPTEPQKQQQAPQAPPADVGSGSKAPAPTKADSKASK